MTTPRGHGCWLGFNTDWRQDLSVHCELELGWSEVGDQGFEIELGTRWVQSDALNHDLTFEFNQSHHDAQWLANFDNPGGGIGDVSYVFGSLRQKTWDLTLRSNLLFSRNQSLEVYLQPFLTVGDYIRPQELLRPDSYDLAPFASEGFDLDNSDFSYGAVNLNLVYRWEYRPGSTLFLVWTHSRETYQERGFFADPGEFPGGFSTAPLFKNEPENTFLVKMTYWFSL